MLKKGQKVTNENILFNDNAGSESKIDFETVEEPVVFWTDNIINQNSSQDLFGKTLKWLSNK